MIKAQTIFDGNGVAHGCVELGQVDDFLLLTYAPDFDAVKIQHVIFSVPAQNVIGFEISLPDMGIIEFPQPQAQASLRPCVLYAHRLLKTNKC